MLAAELQRGPHSFVLDLGCGDASLVRFVQPHRYIGVDAHEPSLARARKRYAGVGRDFVLTDLDSAPLASWRGADVVCLSSVTHHLPDEAVIDLTAQIAETVRPRRILVQDAHPTGPLGPLVTTLDDGRFLRRRDALVSLLEDQFTVSVLWAYDNPLRSFHQFLLELVPRAV
jgi:SAM-dependent methyltransferase